MSSGMSNYDSYDVTRYGDCPLNECQLPEYTTAGIHPGQR